MVRPAQSRSWWRRITLPVKIASIAVVILLVTGAGYWVYIELRTCGPDVDLVGGQCIGVTDGTVQLSPNLADVLGKIREANERVDRSGRHAVSVAYLAGLPAPSSNEALEVTLRHELEGAYLAQRQANQNENQEPLIRLLVANDGERSQQWQRVVSALVDKVDGPERLVAVVASGQTVTARQEAVGSLTTQGIPVIASRLTGDTLIPTAGDPAAVQGLARLAPSNSDQTAAAAAHLKLEPDTKRALLIQNTDPGDTYSQSLGDAFRRTFPDGTHEVLDPTETYNPRLGGVEGTMRDMLTTICPREPDVIFFAGRSTDLEAFVKALPNRPCPGLRINLVTGSDAVDFANSVAQDSGELRQGLSAHASVQYTVLAHPGSWEASPDSFAQGSRNSFRSDCEDCFPAIFPGEPLDDGAAIMGHDALHTAVTAIRTREGINDKPELIIQKFKRLHGPQAVPGASGWISLDEHGNPINKAVPILEVNPDGTVVFVQLSSPGHAPNDPPGDSPCLPTDPALC